MEVLIDKVTGDFYKVHLVHSRNLSKVITRTVFKKYIIEFNNQQELINDIWEYFSLLSSSRFHVIPPSFATQVWDKPYYNHAKRTMYTFEMLKLLN